jgi:hypothetical protein
MRYDPVDHIMDMVGMTDKSLRSSSALFPSVISQIDHLHPRGHRIKTLMRAEATLRELADALKAQREAVTEADEVAA